MNLIKFSLSLCLSIVSFTIYAEVIFNSQSQSYIPSNNPSMASEEKIKTNQSFDKPINLIDFDENQRIIDSFFVKKQETYLISNQHTNSQNDQNNKSRKNLEPVTAPDEKSVDIHVEKSPQTNNETNLVYPFVTTTPKNQIIKHLKPIPMQHNNISTKDVTTDVQNEKSEDSQEIGTPLDYPVIMPMQDIQ